MPAQKHCQVFDPIVGDVLGYAIRYAPIPRSGTVSWVLCRGARHPLSPVIEGYSTPKKERKLAVPTEYAGPSSGSDDHPQNIISTNFCGLYKAHSPHLTLDDS